MANAIPVSKKSEVAVEPKVKVSGELPEGFIVPANAKSVTVVPGQLGASPSVRVEY